MIKLPLNEEFLEWAIKSGLEQALVTGLRQEIQARGKGNTDQFLATLSAKESSARGHWERSVETKANRIKNRRSLLKFLRLLKPTIQIDTRTEPWNRWVHGSKVVVFVGQREVTIDRVARTVRQHAVGARDSEAFAELGQILVHDLGLACEIDLEHLPADMSSESATAKLQDWRRRSDVGLICVLGSSVVNSLTNPLTRAILRQSEHTAPPAAPARFRWGFEVGDDWLAETPSKSVDGASGWSPHDEGIAFPGVEQTSFRRIPDDLVFATNHTSQLDTSVFDDCGILALDCRERPFLLLCAGHGGCGTVGCVRQLRETQLIEDLLEASRDPGASIETGADRIFAIVSVKRRMRLQTDSSSRHQVDDLEIESARVAWASVCVPDREWV